jgi:ribosomal protein L13
MTKKSWYNQRRQIWIKKTTCKDLFNFRRKGETYDGAIKRLLGYYKKGVD